MPLRVGEMMVIVRAQDFASRTLRRVSGELAGMSREQAVAHRRNQLMLRQMRDTERFRRLTERGTSLQLMKQRLQAEQRLADLRAKPPRMLVGDPTGAIARHNRAIGNATAQLQRMQQMTNNLTPAMQRMWMQIRHMPNALNLLETGLAGNARALREAAIAAGMTGAEMAAFEKAVRALPVERLDNLGRAISGIGRTMQLFGGLGTVAFGLAARSAANFSTEVSLAATQMRDIGAPFEQIALRSKQLRDGLKQNGVQFEGILDLMQRFPATSKDMADAAYEVFSSMQLQEKGVTNVGKGLSLLEKANKLAVAGGVDLAEATDAMIIVLNNFDPQLRNVNEQFDTMFDIVRFGKMHLSDFGKMMIPLAPVAKGVGQSLESIGGAMAFLTERMSSPERVATGLSRLLEALRHPDMVAGLKKFGVAVNDAEGRMRPLPELLEQITEKFPQLRTGQKDAANFFRQVSAIGRGGGRGQIFTIQGRRVFDALVQQIDEYLVRQRQIIQNRDEFEKAFQAQLKTPGVQWAIFVNQMRALVLVVGQEVIPVFAQIGVHIQRLVDWFQQLNPETRSMILEFAAMGSVITLLSGVFLALFGGLLVFEASLRKLFMSAGAATAGLGSLLVVAQRLAAIGVIVLAVHLLKGGDMGLWEALGAAGLGALLGARFGPQGAAVGAITVPIILKIMQGDPRTDIQKAYDNYKKEVVKQESGFKSFLKDTLAPFRAGIGGPEMGGIPRQADIMSFEQFTKKVKGLQKVVKEFGTIALSPKQREFWESLDAGLRNTTGSMDKQKKSVNFLDRATRDYINSLRGEAKKAAQAQVDELQRMYDQQLKTGGSTEELARRQAELGRVIEDTTQRARDSLRQMFVELQSENERAFGELFQGPWLTSETFDLAKEWGITPRIQDLIRDLHEQNAEFARWRSSLDRLMKRGLPGEFIDELRAMGPKEGQAIIDQILGATPQQTRRLINEWQRKNTQIKEATKIDFTREVEQFRAAGGDMGEAIINGFKNAGVGAWFDNWINATFPGIINSAVQRAVQEWKQQNPLPNQPPNRLGANARPGANGGSPGGGGGRNTTNNDNSKNITVVIRHPEEGRVGAETTAQLRRAAFDAVNIIKGVL